MDTQAVIALTALAFLLGACEGARRPSSSSVPPTSPAPASASSPAPTPTPLPPPSTASVRPQPGLPPAVADKRAGIIVAARRGDPDFLRFLLKPPVFLSDYGFGKIPVDRWIAPKDK